MNNKSFLIKMIPYFFISLLITSCGEIIEKKKVEKPSLNIMILLDLSDRLIKQDGQPTRDKDLIQYICSNMPIIIRDGNGMRKSKEVMKIQIADQDDIPYSTKSYSDSLYFKMSKDVRGGFPAVRRIMDEKFPRNLNRLYQEAVFSNDADDYSGANISRYFIRNLKTDIRSDSMALNLLFIFTDGYIVVGQDKDVMLDAHNQFPDLKIMVLETSPGDQNYESERMQKNWDSWFARMAIQGYALRNNNTPLEALKSDISKFLAGSLKLTIPGQPEIPPHDPKPIPAATSDTPKKTENKNEPNRTNEISDPPKTKEITQPKKSTETITPPSKVTIKAPSSLEECFQLLSSGKLADNNTKFVERTAVRFFEGPQSKVFIVDKFGTTTRIMSAERYLDHLSIQQYIVTIDNQRSKKDGQGKFKELYVNES